LYVGVLPFNSAPSAVPAQGKPDLVDRFCDAIEALTAERASRSYAVQWIMVHDVARHLGITAEQAQQAVALCVARNRILTDGSEPPHSLSLNRGLREG
jgi:hypothetical protein